MTALNAPNFLVIGAQKAGTTYLCSKISAHPDIYFSPNKEPLFFHRNFSGAAYSQYLSTHFAGVKAQTWIGEGSTVYFQVPRALDNISKVLSPDIKIIICLRQPTEKAVSAYLHNWKRGKYPAPVSILDAPAIANGLGPRRSSLYYQHVLRWLSIYSRRQIEIILFDRLKEDPVGFVSQALNFLGVDGIVDADPEPVNKGADLVWDGDVLTVQNPRHRWRPEIRKSELLQLHESYLQDIERLDDLLHLGISHWKELPKFSDAHRSSDLLSILRKRA
jgi:hypothetical protein